MMMISRVPSPMYMDTVLPVRPRVGREVALYFVERCRLSARRRRARRVERQAVVVPRDQPALQAVGLAARRPGTPGRPSASATPERHWKTTGRSLVDLARPLRQVAERDVLDVARDPALGPLAVLADVDDLDLAAFEAALRLRSADLDVVVVLTARESRTASSTKRPARRCSSSAERVSSSADAAICLVEATVCDDDAATCWAAALDCSATEATSPTSASTFCEPAAIEVIDAAISATRAEVASTASPI